MTDSGLNIQAGWCFWSPLWYTSALHTFWGKCLPDSPVPFSFSPNFRQKENIWLSLRSRLPSFTWNNRLIEVARSTSPLPASPYRNQAFHKRHPCVAIWTQEQEIAVIYVEWIKKKKKKKLCVCRRESVGWTLRYGLTYCFKDLYRQPCCSRSGLRGTHAVLAESTYNCTLEITTHPRVCAQERQRSCHLSACKTGAGEGKPCPLMVGNEACGGAVTSRLAGTSARRAAGRVRPRTPCPRVMSRGDGRTAALPCSVAAKDLGSMKKDRLGEAEKLK